MNASSSNKIKNTAIYFTFIILFLVSLFILFNERLDILDKLIKPVEKLDESIKIIDQDTKWSYIGQGENPGVGNVWATSNYDASSWGKGYGDFGEGTETSISSHFFRYEFNIEKDVLETINGIEGKIEYNAAVIVYLNGSIIFAGNVPAGGYNSNSDTGASQITDGKYRNSFQVTDLHALKQGKNIIGVEIHSESIGRDMYFNFHRLDLSKREFQKTIYNMDGLVLEKGDIDDEIFVNYMTDSHDFFRLEYIEEEEYRNEKDFSKYGKTVLMGRKRLIDSSLYLNNVQIPRLKDDTKYIYRIFKIGDKKASKIYSFKTGKRKGFSFAFLASPPISNMKLDEFSSDWDGLLDKSLPLVGNIDFVITSIFQGDISSTNIKTQQAFIMFRKPEILKQLPILTILTDGEDDEYKRELYRRQFNRKTGNEQGNYYVAYQDTLIISINSNDKDYKLHKSFIEDAIDKTKRKWVIVATHNIDDNKELSDIFDQLDIDLLLDDPGYITKINVDNFKLSITKYSLQTGSQSEEYILEK